MERTIRTGMMVMGVIVLLSPNTGLAASIPDPQGISYPEQLNDSRGNPLTLTTSITLNLNDVSIRRYSPYTVDAVEMTQPV